ncbi:hypothetical protein SFRURICE_017110 [Spodoptera frugiperda]|nr:hypothetical protein SFRURICE_017110 [Spodoptera frugiperda]
MAQKPFVYDNYVVELIQNEWESRDCYLFSISPFYYYILVVLPRWPSGYKCDCRARELEFDSQVGRSITGLFSVFRKFLRGSTESGNVPGIWHWTHHLLHGTYNINCEMCEPYCAPLPNPSGIKGVTL